MDEESYLKYFAVARISRPCIFCAYYVNNDIVLYCKYRTRSRVISKLKNIKPK